MTRNQFFAAMIAAPMAAIAAWKPKPVPNDVLIMKATLDSSGFEAALDALVARLEKLDLPPGETDGLPPVICRIDGKEFTRIFPFSCES